MVSGLLGQQDPRREHGLAEETRSGQVLSAHHANSDHVGRRLAGERESVRKMNHKEMKEETFQLKRIHAENEVEGEESFQLPIKTITLSHHYTGSK